MGVIFSQLCKIEAVISDKPEVYGLTRAELGGIKNYVVDRKTESDAQALSNKILKIVKGNVDLIVLAGFLSVLKGEILSEFSGRIINVHPSLIPSFCGKGMYGIKVHEKALEYGVKYSGCTVHFVDDGTDTGPILLQKVVPVLAFDTPKDLQNRVLEQEHIALTEAINAIIEDRVKVYERKVEILEENVQKL
jgi:phosphoribosylglycinamide formyltransferase-1